MLAPGFHTSAETPRLTRAAYGYQRFMECVPALLLASAVVVPLTLLLISPVLAYVAFGGYLFFWGCQSIHLARPSGARVPDHAAVQADRLERAARGT